MTVRTVELIFRGRDQHLSSVLLASGQRVAQWERAVLTAGRTASTAGVHMQNVLATGAVAVGGALVYGATKAIAFEKAMRNVNSLSHLSEAGLKSLSAQVLELSKRLPTTAQDLAEGLYSVSSSGFAGAGGLTVLEAAAEAASAGMSTTETSVRAITAVLNAYGLGADKAKDVSDVLFQTVNYGVVSFDELASNLGDFIGAGAAAKIPIDQLNSALATMTLTGISGAESATSLNQLITKLVKPSKALAAVYEELGYESGSSALAQKGLRGVMVDIQKATGGNIDAYLKLFPEIRAARGALALAANEGRNYTKVAGQIEDADARRGATLRTLDEQMKAAGNQLVVFRNRMDAALIQGATRGLPILVALMKAAEDGGEAVGRVGAQLIAALGPTWEALRNVGVDAADIAGDLVDAFGPLVQLLALIGVGGAVVTLNALATVLSLITGLMAENEQATAILAAMLGIRFVASTVAAAGGLRALLAYRVLLPMWYGMSGAASSLSGAMTRSAAAARIMNLALAGGLAYALVEGIQTWQRYKTAGDDARESIRGIYEALGDSPSLEGLRQAQADITRLQRQVKDPGSGHWSDFLTKGAKGATEVKAARAAIDELAAAQKRLSEQSLTMERNLTQLAEVTGLSRGKVAELAEAAGIDLTGSFIGANNALRDYQEKVAGQQRATAETAMIKAMSGIADAAGDAEKKVTGLKDALDALMGAQLGINEATRNWEAGFKELSETLAKARGNLNLTTEGGRANSEAIDKQAVALKDLVVAQANSGATGTQLNKTWDTGVARLRSTMAAAGFTKKQIDAYTKSLGLVPGSVNTIVDAAGADSSAAEVKRLRQEIEKLRSKSVTVSVAQETIYKTIGSPPGTVHRGVGMNAHGNIWTESYAGGGIRPLPKSAMIARNGPTLVQWAEPGTGGEAFIPLAQDRRPRSEQILARVADLFGMRVERYAGGGYVNGKWVGPGGPTARQRAAEQARAAKASKKLSADAQDRAYRQASDNGEIRRLLAPVQLDVSMDLSAALGNVTSRLEEMGRNQADVRARRSANPYDSADDFYRRPVASAAAMASGLQKQNQRIRTWQAELQKIARIAGDDVASQLEAMGERGMEAVRAMSTASTKDMKAMAAQMRAMADLAGTSGAEWQRTLRVDTKAQQTFQANLLKLIQRGRADIAAKLAEMGVDQAGSIAAGAAGASTATLNQMAADLAKNAAASDPQLMNALRLAGILVDGGGKVGLVGLADRSSMSVGDVYALLDRYRGQVFGKLGGGAMTQVDRDLALIASGRAPSGLAAGGIVSAAGAASGALHYRWAEPGSGGESLIPHGPGARNRALALWRETGQILGAGGPAGSVTVVVQVAAGAVQVPVMVSGSQLTAGQVEAAATAAVTKANDQLLRRIRQKAGAR